MSPVSGFYRCENEKRSDSSSPGVKERVASQQRWAENTVAWKAYYDYTFQV